MKRSTRNYSVFWLLGMVCVTASGGCSSEEAAGAGFGNSGNATAGTFSSGGSSAGSGDQPSAGTSSQVPVGGTFGSGTAGTSTAGGGTAGVDAGGTDAGGAGGANAGTNAGGSAGAGGTGATTSDFPANCPMPAATHSANPATRSCWSVLASECAVVAGNDGLMNPASAAIDADSMTRFSTGAKMTVSKAFTYDIDLGSAIMIDGVTVTSMTTDYAPQLAVYVSTDGTAFTPVACGTGNVTTDFAFTPVSARYVRLEQHGIADSWWSIHDLNVYRSSDQDSCGGGGTAMTACTVTHTTI